MREREHRFGFNLWTGGPTISQLPKKKITKKIPGGQIRPSVQCPTEDCKIKPACRHVAGVHNAKIISKDMLVTGFNMSLFLSKQSLLVTFVLAFVSCNKKHTDILSCMLQHYYSFIVVFLST